MMKQRICTMTAIATLLLGSMAQAEILAQWNFAAASNQTADITGNGHDGTAGSGVTFNTTSGATFDGSNDGDITIPNANLTGIMPTDIGLNEIWTMSIDGVKLDGGSSYRCIFSCRNDSEATGPTLYINGNNNFQFRMGTGAAGGSFSQKWVVLTNTDVVVNTTDLYDVEITWDGSDLALDVNGQVASLTPSSALDGSPGGNDLFFGNGGDTGTQYFYPGKIAGATIDISPVPEPSSIALLATLIAGLIFVRRR